MLLTKYWSAIVTRKNFTRCVHESTLFVLIMGSLAVWLKHGEIRLGAAALWVGLVLQP